MAVPAVRKIILNIGSSAPIIYAVGNPCPDEKFRISELIATWNTEAKTLIFQVTLNDKYATVRHITHFGQFTIVR